MCLVPAVLTPSERCSDVPSVASLPKTSSGHGRPASPLRTPPGRGLWRFVLYLFVFADGAHRAPRSALRVARDRPFRACGPYSRLRRSLLEALCASHAPVRASGFDASTKRSFGCVSRRSTDTKPACVLDARSGRVGARGWLFLLESALARAQTALKARARASKSEESD